MALHIPRRTANVRRTTNVPRTPVCLLLTLVGCVESRPRPLYAPTNPPPHKEEVATLSGYVRYVDGNDVSGMGGLFELLPGCHVVETPSQWGTGDQGSAAIITTGKVRFAMPMKARHAYAVDMGPGLWTKDGVGMAATEKDAAGNLTASFRPASEPEIAACRAPASSDR